ncbi:MAG: trimethylamine methyltransferase family protein [Albidovulum sp.]|nr:trimethylamine methyltransferase family protein [Albidovulum sp.]
MNIRTSQRSGGRAARLAKRKSETPEINPAPPGQRGGQYKPLSRSAIRAIYQTALRLLEELGMGESPEKLTGACLSRGAFLNERGRLCFPGALVEDIIADAPKTVALHGRDPGRSFEIGGDRVYFGTGGAAVRTLDIDTGLYRPSTMRDLHDFTRLQDRLENIAWFTRCCIATDIPDNYDLDVNTAYALARGTTKPVATAFFIADHVAPVVRLFDIADGGEGRFSRRPWCVAHISPIISPFRYGEDAVDVVFECIRHNIPVNCITGAQSGATGPAAPASFLAASLAETLASLLMVNCIQPGYPMIFSNWPFVVDLRSGAFCGGGAETAVMNAASAQLSNWLGLPSGVACSMSDAKAVDCQMGMEKGITALAAGLAGGNVIYESCGMSSALLGVSFEAFVLDNEMLANVYRIIRGIEVDRDALGFDEICGSVLGQGHFLGSNQTMRSMQRDFVYPRLADRDSPDAWAERGAPDIRSVAREKAREILSSHFPDYLASKADRKIRDEFKILE